MNHQAGLEYERSFWDQGKHVVGIDEAGRGPIAGPLVRGGEPCSTSATRILKSTIPKR